MKPEDLRAESFERYGPTARAFAVEHLALLRRLPMSVVPSFLEQIQQLDTSFPAERASLRWQCDSLAGLPAARLAELTAPFRQIHLSMQLEAQDWVAAPASFIASLSAELWSSGQIDRFRAASNALFEAIPEQGAHPARLTVVVFGRDASAEPTATFRKLSRRGVLLTALQSQQMPQQIYDAFRHHAAASAEPYAHWYVDGGEPWKEAWLSIPGAVAVSYPQLDPLRLRTLQTMEQIVESGGAGAEEMRSRLARMGPGELDSRGITGDPVLQRFYTDLFTRSSGPQIFSTTFVQWTGRELARRAQPRTLLLRYAPRQRYQAFDELLRQAQPHSLDPEGSLRDAEIGAYYTWIEMNRITAPGKGTFVAWLEGSSQAVILGNNAPAGTQCSSSLTLDQALRSFA